MHSSHGANKSYLCTEVIINTNKLRRNLDAQKFLTVLHESVIRTEHTARHPTFPLSHVVPTFTVVFTEYTCS